jgi:hypothetical protein
MYLSNVQANKSRFRRTQFWGQLCGVDLNLLIKKILLAFKCGQRYRFTPTQVDHLFGGSPWKDDTKNVHESQSARCLVQGRLFYSHYIRFQYIMNEPLKPN